MMAALGAAMARSAYALTVPGIFSTAGNMLVASTQSTTFMVSTLLIGTFAAFTAIYAATLRFIPAFREGQGIGSQTQGRFSGGRLTKPGKALAVVLGLMSAYGIFYLVSFRGVETAIKSVLVPLGLWGALLTAATLFSLLYFPFKDQFGGKWLWIALGAAALALLGYLAWLTSEAGGIGDWWKYLALALLLAALLALAMSGLSRGGTQGNRGRGLWNRFRNWLNRDREEVDEPERPAREPWWRRLRDWWRRPRREIGGDDADRPPEVPGEPPVENTPGEPPRPGEPSFRIQAVNDAGDETDNSRPGESLRFYLIPINTNQLILDDAAFVFLEGGRPVRIALSVRRVAQSDRGTAGELLYALSGRDTQALARRMRMTRNCRLWFYFRARIGERLVRPDPCSILFRTAGPALQISVNGDVSDDEYVIGSERDLRVQLYPPRGPYSCRWYIVPPENMNDESPSNNVSNDQLFEMKVADWPEGRNYVIVDVFQLNTRIARVMRAVRRERGPPAIQISINGDVSEDEFRISNEEELRVQLYPPRGRNVSCRWFIVPPDRIADENLGDSVSNDPEFTIDVPRWPSGENAVVVEVYHHGTLLTRKSRLVRKEVENQANAGISINGDVSADEFVVGNERELNIQIYPPDKYLSYKWYTVPEHSKSDQNSWKVESFDIKFAKATNTLEAGRTFVIVDAFQRDQQIAHIERPILVKSRGKDNLAISINGDVGSDEYSLKPMEEMRVQLYPPNAPVRCIWYLIAPEQARRRSTWEEQSRELSFGLPGREIPDGRMYIVMEVYQNNRPIAQKIRPIMKESRASEADNARISINGEVGEDEYRTGSSEVLKIQIYPPDKFLSYKWYTAGHDRVQDESQWNAESEDIAFMKKAEELAAGENWVIVNVFRRDQQIAQKRRKIIVTDHPSQQWVLINPWLDKGQRGLFHQHPNDTNLGARYRIPYQRGSASHAYPLSFRVEAQGKPRGFVLAQIVRSDGSLMHWEGKGEVSGREGSWIPFSVFRSTDIPLNKPVERSLDRRFYINFTFTVPLHADPGMYRLELYVLKTDAHSYFDHNFIEFEVGDVTAYGEVSPTLPDELLERIERVSAPVLAMRQWDDATIQKKKDLFEKLMQRKPDVLLRELQIMELRQALSDADKVLSAYIKALRANQNGGREDPRPIEELFRQNHAFLVRLQDTREDLQKLQFRLGSVLIPEHGVRWMNVEGRISAVQWKSPSLAPARSACVTHLREYLEPFAAHLAQVKEVLGRARGGV